MLPTKSLFLSFYSRAASRLGLRFLWVGALVLGKKTFSVSTALTNCLIGVLVLVVYVVLSKFTFEEALEDIFLFFGQNIIFRKSVINCIEFCKLLIT